MKFSQVETILAARKVLLDFRNRVLDYTGSFGGSEPPASIEPKIASAVLAVVDAEITRVESPLVQLGINFTIEGVS